LRIKEQETHLTLQEHDDDDDTIFINAQNNEFVLVLQGPDNWFLCNNIDSGYQRSERSILTCDNGAKMC